MTSKSFTDSAERQHDAAGSGSPALRFVLLMGVAAMVLGLTSQANAPDAPTGLAVFAMALPPADWD